MPIFKTLGDRRIGVAAVWSSCRRVGRPRQAGHHL